MGGKTGIIIAARSGSTRLPGKALRELGGVPMIIFLIRRIKATAKADALVLATTSLPEDDELVRIVEAEGIDIFRGANEDVVQRYVDAAADYGLDYVVRITGDCPFVNAETLDYCLTLCEELGKFDIASTKGRFPVGIDYEIYRAASMADLHRNAALSDEDREHLTLYMYQHPQDFRIYALSPRAEWESSDKTFTVDTAQDYDYAQKLVSQLGDNNFPVSRLIQVANNVL